ncbi:hypothetical protein IPJ72_06645 [Candidatus Peregrinibacteria bacterium]|nr:MAG: hypothetical protein IPJ72_06645 [Candidatus Peregrinibacteria bacterium]
MGIGTVTPAYLLDVAGQANAVELCIKDDCRTSWPAGGAGLWTQSGSIAYYNTGNVGVGTATPTHKFEVSGQASATELCIAGDCRAAWPAGGSSLWNQNGSDINYTTGKVGVGSATPTHALDVRGEIRSDVGGNFNVWLQGGSSTLNGDTRNAAIVGTSETNGDRLYLNYQGEYQGGTYITNGYVGIGTSSAVSQLHVQGPISPFNGSTAVTLDGDALADDAVLKVRGNTTLNAHTDADTRLIVMGDGRVGIGTAAPQTGTLLDVNQVLVVTSAGRVGIGVSNPQSSLDVYGGVRAAYDQNVTSYFGHAAIGYNPGYTNSYASFSHVSQNSAGNYALLQFTDGTTFLNSASGRPIYFRHNNVDQMVLTSGRLGIGTTTPNGRLSVSSSGTEIPLIVSYNGSTAFSVNNSGNGSFANDLSVMGDQTTAGNVSIGGDLTVTGDITNLTMSSAYTDSATDGITGFATSMGGTTNRICFLTRTEVQDVDSPVERAGCTAYVQSGGWYLDATATSGTDADSWCEARCLSW